MSSPRKARPNCKPAILAAAIIIAREKGLRNFSRADVATEAGVANATVTFHFKNMDNLRRDIVKHAIDNEVMPSLADARADRQSAALFTRMSSELKQKVAAHISR
jgi:AcrR family transcriptional regulator